MAPIQFRSDDGTWIGVGSRVWVAVAHTPASGIVTGFTRVDDEDFESDVAVVNVALGGTISKACAFGDVFGQEKEAWLHFADLIEEDTKAVSKRIDNLNNDLLGMQTEISKIRQEWQ